MDQQVGKLYQYKDQTQTTISLEGMWLHVLKHIKDIRRVKGQGIGGQKIHRDGEREEIYTGSVHINFDIWCFHFVKSS